MTNKRLIIFAASAVLFIVCVIAYFIYDAVMYGYDVKWGNPHAVVWMFADSAKKDMDLQYACADIRKTDQSYEWGYHASQDYGIQVWEIIGLRGADPHRVPIHTNVFLNKVSLRGEILDKGSIREVQVRFGPFFNGELEIDLDENSKIVRMFEGQDYKGFYGSVGRMAFENGDRQILCMEDYKSGNAPLLFVMYKAHSSFYLIFISANKPFDENMIHILNLK